MLAPITACARALDRIDLGGWLLLWAGLAIIALATLIPAWLELEEVRYQHNLITAQLDQVEQTHANFVSFNAALQRDDPLLLQRLAWRELHLQPAGVRRIDAAGASRLAPTPPIDAWLVADPPPPPGPTPARHWRASRLVRLTTGDARPWMLTIGCLLLAAGLISSLRPIESNEPDNTTGQPTDDALTAELID